MRVRVLYFLVLSIAASASELSVKVIDPSSAAVAGAHVLLIRSSDSKVLRMAVTSAEGTAQMALPDPGSFQVRVLAPGFAAETLDVSAQSEVTVKLRLAPAAESVVVTATRTPVTGEVAGADVNTLTAEQLTTMNPPEAADAVRFLPGAVVNAAGQRGSLTSLFVRGGESRYNKVIVDGVTVNEPGGTFDFGTLPLNEAGRLEFVRGAQSTLYGSDAITSVVQVWTRNGNTRVPELRLGASGGNFSTASGDASLAGAHERFDYNLFADQFNTAGAWTNNAYSDSLQGANVGAALNGRTSLRIRFRHSNSHTGVPGEWNFNGTPLQPPNPSDWSQLNDILGSAELAVRAPSGWEHHLTGFDYLYRYYELNANGDPARVFDFPSNEVDRINRAGVEYQGDYSERTWAHTTFGYRVENENGFVGNLDYPPQTHGQRLNNEAYAQQQLVLGRFDFIAGARFIHNSAFGNTGVPRVAVAWQALRGAERFSGTRLRFSYATGFKEPRLEETFAGPPYTRANTALKPEHSRSFEAGLQQNFSARPVRVHCYLFQQSFSGPDQLCDRRSRELHWRIQQREPGARSWRGSGAASEATLATAAEHGVHLYVNADPGEPRAHQRSVQSGTTVCCGAPNIRPLFCCPISGRGGEEMSPEVSWDAAPTPTFWVSTSITRRDTFAPM